MSESPFQNKLLSSEKILWSGQPALGLLLTARDVLLIPFSLVWCGFAIFWTVGATAARAPGFFTLWGAMFVCIGLYFVFGRFVVDAWVRRTMHYAITNRRILIDRAAPFSKFTAINLATLPDINLSERSDGRGTITFGSSTPLYRNRGLGGLTPVFDPTPQFLAVGDVRRVFDILQSAIDHAKG